VLKHLFYPLAGYAVQKSNRAQDTKDVRMNLMYATIIPFLEAEGLYAVKHKQSYLRVLQPGTGQVQILSVRLSQAGKKFGFFMSFSNDQVWPDWYLLMFPFGMYLLRPYEVLRGQHTIEFFTPEHELLQERDLETRMPEFIRAFTEDEEERENDSV
jgi:hypothetical protein